MTPVNILHNEDRTQVIICSPKTTHYDYRYRMESANVFFLNVTPRLLDDYLADIFCKMYESNQNIK